MAEAEQKDQTNPAEVAADDTAPGTLDDVTGFSNGAGEGNAKPAPAAAPEAPPAQPQNTAPETAAEDGAETATASPQGADAPSGQEEEASTSEAAAKEKAAHSKFLDNEWQEMLLRQAWKVDDLDPDLAKIVKSIAQNKKTGGLFFNTDHGKFEWGKAADGSEYIGRRGIFNRLSQDLADEEALVAKSRGWTSVSVHGSNANKEKLWLAAMRAGLSVGNYTPPENSKVLEIWKNESAEFTGLTSKDGVPEADAPKQDATKDAAPEVPAADAPAAPAADAPASSAAAETLQPETPAAQETSDADADADAPAPEPAAGVPPEEAAPETVIEAPVTEAPTAPLVSKFGIVEPKKAEPEVAAPEKADLPSDNPPQTRWEQEKKERSASPEGQKIVESVESLGHRAAETQDPAHRAGIEKLQEAIKSGKVSVDNPVEREIIDNVGSPKGFQKAADYFSKKAGSDLGLPKVEIPAGAETTAPKNAAPKNKGPA
jgi:anti-sigma28 factor (negative regulator of flagellin synthesis)